MPINQVIFNGRLGAEPDLRYTANGLPVINMLVINSRNFTGGAGDRRQDSTAMRVTVFGTAADLPKTDPETGQSTGFGGTVGFILDYVKKGYEVTVSGRLNQQFWTAPGTQERRSTIEIIANSVDLHTSREDGARIQSQQAHRQAELMEQAEEAAAAAEQEVAAEA
jgi:single-strand DNA-binding protein